MKVEGVDEWRLRYFRKIPMSGSDIGMIIRTNLVAPDIQITAGELFDTDIERVHQEVRDSHSEYFIDSEYLRNR